MPTVELNLEQIIKAVKQLKPVEKVILWERIGSDLAKVTEKIRAQARKLNLTKLSNAEIEKFIHQVRKERGQNRS
ncbi:MAG: hypothetical protein J7L42_03335 [Elusimicrobia bacterium]|nr:hypothetical protein [Elusimicrobiota bacterium]